MRWCGPWALLFLPTVPIFSRVLACVYRKDIIPPFIPLLVKQALLTPFPSSRRSPSPTLTSSPLHFVLEGFSMYKQNNQSYDSISRRSSSNPFRKDSMGQTLSIHGNNSALSVHSSNSAFDDWVQKNKTLIDESSDEEEAQVFLRPSFPSMSRAGSDSNVNHDRKMSSNNPFASAMNGEYKHHRDPPPPPKPTAKPIREKKSSPLPPPTYDEVAGSKHSTKEYPQEKASSSDHRTPRSSSKPHRSHSDSGKHQEKKGERRHKSSSKKSSSKKKSPAPHLPQNLDTIDKLDVSAFFGGGFHHDGPFDACTPHRNKNKKAAPVEAFPADGPNTSMKAPPAASSDRLDQAFGNYGDHNMILGRKAKEPVAHDKSDTSCNVPRLNPSVVAFDANEKAAPIHGPSTAGLGSTTFLNGAPAPKGDDYLAPPGPVGGGIGRKKSLVQRLRKNSASDSSSRRSSNDNSGEYHRSSFGEEESSGSLLSRVKSLKVGRK